MCWPVGDCVAMTSTFFANAPDSSTLSDDHAHLLTEMRALLERLALSHLGSTTCETDEDGFGLIIERDDEAVRILMGCGPRMNTLGVEINKTPILMPYIAIDDAVRITEGLLTGEMRLAVMFVNRSAVRVDVVDTTGRTLGRYGLASRLATAPLFWKKRLVFDVNFNETTPPPAETTETSD
jgi:hypothetical protein